MAAYLRHYRLSRGERRQRLESEAYFWAWEAVRQRLAGDEDPLALLDVLVRAAGDDQDLLAYLGAACVEELIGRSAYLPELARRAVSDPHWATAITGVRVHAAEFAALPAPLRNLISDVIRPPSR